MDPMVFLLDTLVFVGIFMILTLSLNLEYGFTGLGNFGKVAFFMVGAYIYAITIQFGLPFYISLVLGAVVAAILGALVSLPALRLREDYLAITTIAFGEIVRIIFKAEQAIAGGVWGIAVPSIFQDLNLSIRMSVIVNLLLIYCMVAVIFIILQMLTNSPYGRVLRSIREDDEAVAALGKNVIYYKVQVFMIGSAIAGIAGGLYAQYLRFIEPNMFLPLVTFFVWIMLILGGTGNNKGALVGALLIEFISRGSRIAKDYVALPVDPHNVQFVLFGILIIILIMYWPNGLLREKQIQTVPERRIAHGDSVSK
ncbi:MAG: branched-chain amino acid ABC transporter permease [Bacillota bacterium]